MVENHESRSEYLKWIFDLPGGLEKCDAKQLANSLTTCLLDKSKDIRQ